MHTNAPKQSQSPVPAVSRQLPSGDLLELVYDREHTRTQFAVGTAAGLELVDDFVLPNGTRLVPYTATNNLIRHEVVLLPSRPEEPGTTEELVGDIVEHLARYVDLDDDVALLAAYYALFTWVYDAFNELPYLRFRGDYGSGKTRALFVLGSLCNKAFFASGASTVSPIFHTLDTFRGTLLFDEADFRFTDEKAELVKILNNGNVRGFPVLRTAVTQKKEFEPRAYMVFGPKLVAMRRSYEDEALESRFFTVEMRRRPLRSTVPINLPDTQRVEALALRNRLLGYRFAHFAGLHPDPSLVDASNPARLSQVLVPLLSIVGSSEARATIRRAVLGMRTTSDADTHMVERYLAGILRDCLCEEGATAVPVGRVAARLIERYGAEIRRPLSSRYVGELLRERLGIATYKSHGVFVVPASEQRRVEALAARLGIIGTDTAPEVLPG